MLHQSGLLPSQISKGVEFINLAITDENISTLYRGFDDIPAVMFSTSTLLLGLFARSLPERLTMEEVRLHKTTNYSNDHYMVSMTEKMEIANGRGKSHHITVDPALFRDFILDVHKTYKRHTLVFPARMMGETEHSTLALLYCSVKSITINNQEIANPFYIAINPDNQEAILGFKKIYIHALNLIRAKLNNEISDENESLALREFVISYMKFYSQYAGENNPFDMPMDELSRRYPEYMACFFNNNREMEFGSLHTAFNLTLFKRSDSFGEIALSMISSLFNNHPYMQARSDSKKTAAYEIQTCNEDPWSRPVYD